MQKTDFNRDWTVQKDGSTEILHVNLPDDAMIREERSKENKTASASAYFAGGKYIYTKIFNLSEDETRQTLILEFEAVYQNAIVFLNGRQVAERPYGYTNFFVDITGKVIAGTNELKVVADNADVPVSYTHLDVMASKESATHKIRAVSGISSPAIRRGYPFPSYRS